MRRKVLLPREFRSGNFAINLNDLVRLERTVGGLFLYRPNGEYCHVDSIFMTGAGDEGNISVDQQRHAVAEEFFRRNKKYEGMEFHTHNRGTIATLGDRYATYPSDLDIREYDARLRTNPDFIGAIVTPKRTLLYGKDNPDLEITGAFPYKEHEVVTQQIIQIAQELGCNLEALIARLRS